MTYIFGAAIRGIWSSVFPAPPSTSNSDTATSSSSADDMDCAEEIPWTDITEAHVSNLRGHVRFLKNIGAGLKVTDKLDEYNKRAVQVLADAEAAALIAGIEISPKDKTKTRTKEPLPAEPKRRRCRSPNPATVDTDSGDDAVFVPKKVKFRSPVAVLAEKAPEFSRKPPPTAAEIAQLSSQLGKHKRPEDPDFEEMSEKGMKRNRNYYIEKRYWRRQQLEGEVTDDEEEDDHAEFAPFPDYIRDRLPASRPAPKRRGSRPFTNELVVPVEIDDSTSTEEKFKSFSPSVTTEDEENARTAPKTTASSSSPKSTIPTPGQTPQTEVKSNKPSAPEATPNAPENPETTQTPHPEANKSRKRTNTEPTARMFKKSTTTPNLARPSKVEAKAIKHSADEDTAECPPTVAKKQKKYIQRLLEDSAKRNSTAENGNGPFVVKRRKVV